MDATMSRLSKCPVLQKKSPEFAKVEYQLQLALGTATAQITNAWVVEQPTLKTQFENAVKSKKLMALNSFIDTADFEKGLSVEKVINEGFPDTSEGRVFTAGLFKLAKSGASSYRVMMCRVAVGKSLVYPVKDQNMLETSRLNRDRFDSIYLKLDDEETNSVYRYQYWMNQKDHVLPVYVIDFGFDDTRESNLREPNCDDPGCPNIATKYCVNDNANFCSSCNEKYHEGVGMLMKKHTVISIENRPRNYGKCDQHKTEDYKFFCTKCKTLLCIYCKINGSHSTGEMANHQLKSIEEAYQEAVNQSTRPDDFSEKYKNNIKSLLKVVKDKIEVVSTNAKETENELYNALEKVLGELHAYTQAKLNVLLADQIELQRRYDELEWSEGFLRYQYQVLEAQNYLKSWFRHIEVRSELVSMPKLDLSDVLADMRVVGKLAVTTNEIVKAGDNNIKNPKPE